jgi:AbrB family looped-hinge helix DNA binding protein
MVYIIWYAVWIILSEILIAGGRSMSKVTAKFQVTIPRKVRAALNIMPGVKVGFVEEGGRFYLVKNPDTDPIDKWCGRIKLSKSSDELVAELRGYGIESID